MKPKYLKKSTTLSSYYKTEHWRSFRKTITDDKNCVCELCGRPRWTKYKNKDIYKKPVRFEIHHKCYPLFHEKRSDCLALCSSCHNFAHQLEDMARSRGGYYQVMYDAFINNTVWEFERYDSR